MHSSYGTKFQPERWLPDPVRARFDVFRPILASLYSLFKQPAGCCGFSTATICCCGTATGLVWLPHSLCVAATQPLCGFHTEATRMGRARHGTGGARKVWRHCRPRLTHTHTHTQDRYPALRGDDSEESCTTRGWTGAQVHPEPQGLAGSSIEAHTNRQYLYQCNLLHPYRIQR